MKLGVHARQNLAFTVGKNTHSNKNEVLFRFKNQNDQDVCIQ